MKNKTNKRKTIRKALSTVLLGLLVITASFSMTTKPAFADTQWPDPGPDSIESQCAIVMEANTGTVLYEKNMHTQCYPASITKIMTTMLALENSSLDETVTFSKDAVYNTEGSGIYRNVDEHMSMKDCLYAVMLESANECAYAVTEHVAGGDYQKFIQMMNDKATSLGCQETHFNNCNGLPDTTHVTSCYDMALIAREAIKNNTFRQIISTSRYDLGATDKSEPLAMFNHHKMICANRTRQYLYKNAIGGKTGYTNAAGNTLVTYAEKDGMMLICVVMRSNSTAQWNDTRNLFEYCFNNFALYNVSQNETRFNDASLCDAEYTQGTESYAKIDTDAAIVLPRSASFADTQTEVNYDQTSKQVLGTLVYKYGDRTVGTANVVSTGNQASVYPFSNVKQRDSSSGADLSAASASSAPAETSDKSGHSGFSSHTVLIIIGIAAVVVIVLVAVFVIRSQHRSRGWRETQHPKRNSVKIKDAHKRRRN